MALSICFFVAFLLQYIVEITELTIALEKFEISLAGLLKDTFISSKMLLIRLEKFRNAAMLLHKSLQQPND